MAQKPAHNEEKNDRVGLTLLGFYFLFFGVGIWVVIKLICIQFFWEIPQNSLEEFIPNYEETIIKPDRGDILDCNGKILASSAPLYSLRMDCCIQKDYFASGKKIKVGKDSIAEQQWRQMAWEMCQELPKLVNNGKSSDDYYNLIIKNRESKTLKGRRNVLLITDISHSTMNQDRKSTRLNSSHC